MSLSNLFSRDAIFTNEVSDVKKPVNYPALGWLDEIRFFLRKNFHPIDQVSEHEYLAGLYRQGILAEEATSLLLKFRNITDMYKDKRTIPAVETKIKPREINKQMELF